MDMLDQNSTSDWKSWARDGVIILLAAWVFRLLYIRDMMDFPTWIRPIVDARTYHNMAALLAAGGNAGELLYWQSPLYPMLLSKLYSIWDACIPCARILQALIGSISCVLVYGMARINIDRRTGWIAAAICVFYLPLIYFETQLLSAGLAIFSLLLFLVCIGFVRRRLDSPWLFLVLGIAGGFAALARPPLLPFVLASALYATVADKSTRDMRTVTLRIGLIIVGSCFLLYPFSQLNKTHTGRFTFLPSSGGINLFLGNNPDWNNTLFARPGVEWRKVYSRPYDEGATNAWQAAAFFKKEVREYALTQPGAFLGGLLKKSGMLLSAHEIPRNTDIYIYHAWSPMLKAGAWRLGLFGFPFSILFGFALAGLWAGRRRIPAEMIFFLLLYPAVIVLFFPTARYRILTIPILAVAAACGILQLAQALSKQQVRSAGGILLLTAAGCMISMGGAMIPIKDVDFEAELYRSVGRDYVDEKMFYEALPLLKKALALEPELLNAQLDMGQALGMSGQIEEAIDLLERATLTHSNHAGLHYNLGLFYRASTNLPLAEKYLLKAIELDPSLPHAHGEMARLRMQQGKRWEAEQYRALEEEIQRKE